MCRLFGLISRGDVDIQYWMLDAVHRFAGWSDVHCHGWGIGWYENGVARVEKEPVTALGSRKFSDTAKDTKSNGFVCHLRKATRGEQTYCNSQPFIFDNWLFAHNGTVDRDYLIPKLTDVRRTIEGETDSAVYFHWLLQNLEEGGLKGLRSGIDEVRRREFTALNFVLADGCTLYAYWEQSASAKVPYHDYYQLYYLELAKPRGLVVVCSERLDNEKWLQIPHRSLLIISEQMKTKVISFL